MMSAHDRPVWGREAGRFSTFTARAGRLGTLGRVTPVSGQSFRGGEAPAGDPLWEPPPGNSGLPFPRPPRYRTPTTSAATRTIAAIQAGNTGPRRVWTIRSRGRLKREPPRG